VNVLYPVAAMAAAALACGAPAAPGPSVVRQVSVQGLEQTVQVIPGQPMAGREVQILSVVSNRGSSSVAVQSRMCGLDLAGDVALVMNYLRCAAYSMSGQLAPGDSVTDGDMRVVSSPPGHYTLRVRQLLQPETWVEIPLDVR
jgi:hypothetical protein